MSNNELILKQLNEPWQWLSRTFGIDLSGHGLGKAIIYLFRKTNPDRVAFWEVAWGNKAYWWQRGRGYWLKQEGQEDGRLFRQSYELSCAHLYRAKVTQDGGDR
jgi:hypothetical protein